jgi:pimeloyl-ACP methyl ester carboxylesterase
MLKILLILLIIYFVSMLVLFLVQKKLIFQGVKLNPNYKFTISQNFDEVNLKTNDGSTINALHLKADNPKGIILYFHGNKDNLERWSYISNYFTKFNYDVFVMDYRSYGKSIGKLDEELLYNDALVCYDYVKKLFLEDKITIYGRSLGCTFALKVATVNNPKQLILEAPFYNLTDVAKGHYPLMPFNFLMQYKFDSNKLIDKITCKTTIFHGDQDNVISIKSGYKLFEKSNKNITDFIKIENGTHHNLMSFDLYKNTIQILLN